MKYENFKNNILKGLLIFLILLLPGPALAGWFNGGTNVWGGPGTVVSYSYDFVGGYVVDGGGLSQAVPLSWAPVIDGAFNEWASHCDLSFVKVADSGHDWNAAGAAGDIRITTHFFDGAHGTLGHGYYPPPNGVSAAGDIHFDYSEDWYVGFGSPGINQIDLFTVALHEIGHAIGLDHSADTSSIMYPTYTGGTTKRDLSSEDIGFIEGQYGEATPEPETLLLFLVCLAGMYLMAPPKTIDPKYKKTDDD